MIKIAIIQKLPSGKYRLYSKKKGLDGKRKNLGIYDSLQGAKDREKQVQYFKHQADDGLADDKETKMLSDLSDIAAYLEKAGFIDKADKVYMAMNLIDGSLSQDADDIHTLPGVQMNTENQGYVGGDGVGGGYSGLHAPMVGQPADDEMDNVDQIASSNGLWGNTVTENGGAGQFNVLNDSYFYRMPGSVEDNI